MTILSNLPHIRPVIRPRTVLRWSLRLLAMAALVAAWLFYSGNAKPTPVSGSWSMGIPYDGTVTVMTYNIRYSKGIDDRIDLQRVADIIRESGAQVVALQEVERAMPRSGMAHQARHLARLLDMDYVYAPNLGMGQMGYGNAILSAFPIVDWETKRFPGILERRGIVRVTLELEEGKEIHVFNTHLSFNSAEVGGQARQAMDFIAGFPGKKIIMGDLNLRETSGIVQVLQSRYIDVGEDAGFTFPTASPRARIDYIFASRSILVDNAWVIWSPASDHLPVIARLQP